MASSTSTENPQSSSTDARTRAHSPSPGESGARVGFLESIFMRARASETASPRGIPTTYLLFAVLPEAFGLDFDAALTGCFLAAGFIVGFFAAGFFAGAACFAATCLTGAAGGDADHVLHGSRHLAASLEADFVRLRRHFGDRIFYVGTPVTGAALGRNRSWRG